jgi:N utilization substance protein B
MSRKTAREIALHLIFEMDFTGQRHSAVLAKRLSGESFEEFASEAELYAVPPDERDSAFIRRVTAGVDEHLTELDTYIERYSVGWRFSRISRIVLCIMRLSMFEVLYMPDEVPPASSINEAVEFAKKYDSPEAAAFINGILGTFSRKEVAQ